jgi:hypothetical protein
MRTIKTHACQYADTGRLISESCIVTEVVIKALSWKTSVGGEQLQVFVLKKRR